jgi:2TM domain
MRAGPIGWNLAVAQFVGEVAQFGGEQVMSATFTGSNARPPQPGEADTSLREEAIASLKRKRKCVENVIGYVAVNGVLWLIWALTDRSTGGGMPWPAWVSLIWGFLLAIDVWKAFGSWPGSLHRPISEEEVEREMRRFRSGS